MGRGFFAGHLQDARHAELARQETAEVTLECAMHGTIGAARCGFPTSLHRVISEKVRVQKNVLQGECKDGGISVSITYLGHPWTNKTASRQNV